MTTFRKQDRIQQILATRSNRPGPVHIFSAMEPCPTYEPWHDKKTGCSFIRRVAGKCLHYYFYFIDEMLGLCFLARARLPARARSGGRCTRGTCWPRAAELAGRLRGIPKWTGVHTCDD